MRVMLVLMAGLFWLCAAWAQPQGELTHVQAKAYQTLIHEVRCVTCVNQNIADSYAPVAQAIKSEIFQQVQQGHTSDEIKSYLIARYGDAILYQPQLNASTTVLWFAPILFILVAFFVWMKHVPR
jgi:cytochrome c-type biogenesis protein CcmH